MLVDLTNTDGLEGQKDEGWEETEETVEIIWLGELVGNMWTLLGKNVKITQRITKLIYVQL